MDGFDESDSEDVIDDLPAKMKSLKFSENYKFVYFALLIILKTGLFIFFLYLLICFCLSIVYILY